MSPIPGLSSLELLVGYDLAGPPTLARLLLHWRFDLVFGTAALALAALYLLGLRRLRRRGKPWPAWRTTAWLAGCLVILLATSSGIGRYAPAMFSLHMVSQLLLAVLAPVLLVLGGPILLALRTGPRKWLTSLLRSPACRLLTRPAVAFALLIGPLYLLYLSGLFTSLAPHHWAYLGMNAFFLIAGYLFFWPVIGADPAPGRLPPVGRVLMMFALLAAFGFLAVALSNMHTVLGEGFYWSLNLAWQTDLLADQTLGGTAVWALGELPALILLIATAVQWAKSDERNARRTDESGDTDLAAYNTMLTQLNEQTRDRPRS